VNKHHKRNKQEWTVHYGLISYKDCLESIDRRMKIIETLNEPTKSREKQKIDDILNNGKMVDYKKSLEIISTDKYYDLFIDKYFNELSIDEIALKYNVNKSSVHYNINRLLGEIADMIYFEEILDKVNDL